MRRSLDNSKLGLPDFITMTNACEALGYEIKFVNTIKGILVNVYKDNILIKKGKKVFDTCIDAQAKSYTKLYKALFNSNSI